jgi:preprotein translocase subunit SecA
MLRVIDTRWREHLYEMDYLQDGIHLRAMGQKDPLVEWQREGFGMFAAMVDAIAGDFVKYVMHLQVVHQPPPEAEEVRNVEYSAPEEPSQGAKGIQAAAVAEARAAGEEAPEPEEPETMAPVIRSAEEKMGRNELCHCGSGKKFKHCHGR